MINFLDLRNKVKPHIEIIHKTARKQHPWCAEITKILLVTSIVGTAVWGVSKADEMQQPEPAPVVETFSVMGLVSATTPTSLSVDNVNNLDNVNTTLFDASTLEKIETSQYIPLQFSDIQIGDKIIVQGITIDNISTARRIISFTSIPSATTTATTTDELATTTPDIATTTDIISTSTDEISSSTSTTTPSFIENVVDAVTDTVQNIIDTIFGTSTPEATTTDKVATTTDETATTTEEVSTPTTTPEVVPETPLVIEETPVTDTANDADTGTTTENNI